MSLARLGWPPRKIAEEMKIQGADFARAMETNTLLHAAYETGVLGQSEAAKQNPKVWFPEPEQLEKVKTLAGDGLGKAEIAAQLGVPISAFTARLNDTPDLHEAFQQGLATWNAFTIGKLRENVAAGKEASIIFSLKARAGWSDKVQIQHSGEVTITGVLKAPEKQKPENFSNFAAKEMSKINRRQMQEPVQTEIKLLPGGA
jgi:hypothetical protein